MTLMDAPRFDPDLWPDGLPYGPPGTAEAVAVVASGRAARIKALTYRRSQLDTIPPPSWLIDGVMNDNALAVIAGKFGTYKSFISVSWACSIATGVPWLDHDVITPGPVVYIAAEGASGMRFRIEAWESVYHRGQKVPDDRLVVVGGAVNLRVGADVDAIDALCTEVAPRMVVWDTLHRCAPGVEENSNTEMGLVVATLDGLRERHNCTQLVNHPHRSCRRPVAGCVVDRGRLRQLVGGEAWRRQRGPVVAESAHDGAPQGEGRRVVGSDRGAAGVGGRVGDGGTQREVGRLGYRGEGEGEGEGCRV